MERETAMKILKELHNKSLFDERTALETIIPELKESEDEKIRKELICFLETEIPQCNARDKYIAWIEKQGEQKPADSAKTCKDEQKSADKGESNLLTVERAKEISPFMRSGFENESVERSEEDEKMTKNLTSELYNLEARKLIDKETKDKYTKWLKSLKERYTWKPSDEQMECLYDAIKHYQTNGYPASKLNELYEQMSKIYKL